MTSFIFIAALFLVGATDMEIIMLWSFLIGNVVYYLIGIIVAYTFKDNRAICKYICPVTVFLKPMSYFSLCKEASYVTGVILPIDRGYTAV